MLKKAQQLKSNAATEESELSTPQFPTPQLSTFHSSTTTKVEVASIVSAMPAVFCANSLVIGINVKTYASWLIQKRASRKKSTSNLSNGSNFSEKCDLEFIQHAKDIAILKTLNIKIRIRHICLGICMLSKLQIQAVFSFLLIIFEYLL